MLTISKTELFGKQQIKKTTDKSLRTTTIYHQEQSKMTIKGSTTATFYFYCIAIASMMIFASAGEASSNTSLRGGARSLSCYCPTSFAPVLCGPNDLYFANECNARCYLSQDVECRPKPGPLCACQRIYAPVVCGPDNEEFNNDCLARCNFDGDLDECRPKSSSKSSSF